MILFDFRWAGDHGIGRVCQILDQRLCLPHLKINGRPSSPFDPLRLFVALLKTPRGTVVFSPGYNAPLFVVRPYIFTIHDLNHVDRQENSGFLKKLYYRFIMRRACHNSIKVLTVSEYSRQRILQWAQLPAEQVVNIGNGVDKTFSPNVMPYRPGYRYLLCVSNRKLHKNEYRLLKAFAMAQIDPTIRLIFTGAGNEQLLAKCSALGIKGRVVFSGAVPQNDLPGLYRGALALVFPSLYEGFGLPVVEAMACGIPVITSNTTSLPEVAGDAALLVDPLNSNEISLAIEAIVNDRALHAELSEKGLSRARLFTWDAVLDKVKSVLDNAEQNI